MNRATAQMALEALKCALKAFEFIDGCRGVAILDPIGLRENLKHSAEAIAALEADLAQPVKPVADALRLADWLDADACDLQTPLDAAAELRRLHALNAELLHVLLRIVSNPLAQIGGAMRAEAVASIAKATGAAS